uniref:Uncharacterized protein n=1 Tax=Arundo donax TaxID=35708 RepID=A0A0A9B856_ARUDO
MCLALESCYLRSSPGRSPQISCLSGI